MRTTDILELIKKENPIMAELIEDAMKELGINLDGSNQTTQEKIVNIFKLSSLIAVIQTSDKINNIAPQDWVKADIVIEIFEVALKVIKKIHEHSHKVANAQMNHMNN